MTSKDELKINLYSYEELEQRYKVLCENYIKLKNKLQKTTDALLYSLVQSDYERNCNLEKANHYEELYLEESMRADKLFDKLEKLKNDK